MKTILRLAVLALAGTTALALAGNALATQKLSVKQSTTSLTIKVSQAQTDAQPAKISIYVPSGYSINVRRTHLRPGSAPRRLEPRSLGRRAKHQFARACRPAGGC
ncbi:MAG: hypothetical protein E6G09_09315 [Actinobacteria bacterium]|nr:MAG: hypothetical protein E6G09_09315 [Actinomycetota bacterium]